MSIRVVLADDHALVLDGIRAVVHNMGEDIEIVGEAANGNDVLKMAQLQKADVYVLDISMPLLNGIETTGRLLKMNPDNRVIILSMHDDRASVERALEAGARGYVVKKSAAAEVIQAIRDVAGGGVYLSSSVTGYLVDSFLSKPINTETQQDRPVVVRLTSKEREVLQLIAEGHTRKEIAAALNVSVNTVHVHTNNIMQKLNIHKKADLIRFALKENMVQI